MNGVNDLEVRRTAHDGSIAHMTQNAVLSFTFERLLALASSSDEVFIYASSVCSDIIRSVLGCRHGVDFEVFVDAGRAGDVAVAWNGQCQQSIRTLSKLLKLTSKTSFAACAACDFTPLLTGLDVSIIERVR